VLNASFAKTLQDAKRGKREGVRERERERERERKRERERGGGERRREITSVPAACSDLGTKSFSM
jgi:hypothetical protein